MNNQINPKFKEWACSFSGCDGGNINSSVWVCGLEWGRPHYENNQIQDRDLEPKFVSGSWDTNDEDVRTNLTGSKMGFNQKLAWFYSYLLGWNICHYKDEAVNNHLFCQEGTGFKMNAFPISFKDRESIAWTDTTRELTGLQDFEDYRKWCIEYRGDFFYKLIEKHNPRMVVCTGITSSNDFIEFFKCEKSKKEPKDNFVVCPTNNNNTLIFVVPFFNARKGILRYVEMEKLVSNINAYGIKYFNEDKWFLHKK